MMGPQEAFVHTEKEEGGGGLGVGMRTIQVLLFCGIILTGLNAMILAKSSLILPNQSTPNQLRETHSHSTAPAIQTVCVPPPPPSSSPNTNWNWEATGHFTPDCASDKGTLWFDTGGSEQRLGRLG